MYLQALANRVPPTAYTQKECWEMLQPTEPFKQLLPRSRYILEKVLISGASGIEKRHLAVPDIQNVFKKDAGQLNREFEREAPLLAADALTDALEQASLKPDELDALIVCTCTGYICPGITSYVAERLNMRRDTYLQDIVGLGCGAAVPTLRAAEGLIAANPGMKVGVIAVEICSAAFYLDDDPGVLVSLCLFGDGASASIWTDKPGPTGLQARNFDTVHLPEDRELLRFENKDGKLRNKLHLSVPQKAGIAVEGLFRKQDPSQIAHVLSHAGGRDVLVAVAKKLKNYELHEAEVVLANYGNMSSPSVLFALDEYLKGDNAPLDGKDLWLTSFGAGFAAHSFRLGL
ncbi:stilbene synthase [Ruficoccus amylovorans]|uniref:Stilbene synthase n=1 Tax=Ruficoccus amylovorans TaxID=1804625 RepID=A0A842HBB8_9BACT|nr:3-oxoacyl-[acyl-carrier-protein] synthase III C-terminal domain-containing protein [Ruficoccus amylovorans]MBC2593006.1 stilbene synthase [Ruficoccus amylovorans]